MPPALPAELSIQFCRQHLQLFHSHGQQVHSRWKWPAQQLSGKFYPADDYTFLAAFLNALFEAFLTASFNTLLNTLKRAFLTAFGDPLLYEFHFLLHRQLLSKGGFQHTLTEQAPADHHRQGDQFRPPGLTRVRILDDGLLFQQYLFCRMI